MILAIDIGNTTVALGGIKDGRVCFVAHMDTVRTRTAAEYRIEMEKVFAHRRHPEKPIRFEGAVLTSVVPQITGALAECARYYTGKKPVIVSPEIRTGLTMGVPDPHAVGKDRLVDAAYAAANFPLPVITVDLGTATTFNVVDENRVFRGGVICPGLSTGLRALGERCAQLPQVRLSSPKAAIGVNTESCMLSGSVLGTAVLLDGITQRIEEELGRPATLVVTGGLAKYVTPLCRHPLTYGVPCGCDVFALFVVAVFTFKDGEGGSQIQFLGDQPLYQNLRAIRTSLSGRSQQFIANHSIVISFAGKRNPVYNGERNFVIVFIESFDGDFERISFAPTNAQTFLADFHIAQIVFVDIHSVIIFKTECRVRRQLIIKSCISAYEPVLGKLVGKRYAGRKLVGE